MCCFQSRLTGEAQINDVLIRLSIYVEEILETIIL